MQWVFDKRHPLPGNVGRECGGVFGPFRQSTKEGGMVLAKFQGQTQVGDPSRVERWFIGFGVELVDELGDGKVEGKEGGQGEKNVANMDVKGRGSTIHGEKDGRNGATFDQAGGHRYRVYGIRGRVGREFRWPSGRVDTDGTANTRWV